MRPKASSMSPASKAANSSRTVRSSGVITSPWSQVSNERRTVMCRTSSFILWNGTLGGSVVGTRQRSHGMPRTADIPAPIAESEVRLGRYLSVHRHAGVDADHALLMHQPVAAPAGDIDHFCARHAARAVGVWRISEPAAA